MTYICVFIIGVMIGLNLMLWAVNKDLKRHANSCAADNTHQPNNIPLC